MMEKPVPEQGDGLFVVRTGGRILGRGRSDPLPDPPPQTAWGREMEREPAVAARSSPPLPAAVLRGEGAGGWGPPRVHARRSPSPRLREVRRYRRELGSR